MMGGLWLSALALMMTGCSLLVSGDSPDAVPSQITAEWRGDRQASAVPVQLGFQVEEGDDAIVVGVAHAYANFSIESVTLDGEELTQRAVTTSRPDGRIEVAIYVLDRAPVPGLATVEIDVTDDTPMLVGTVALRGAGPQDVGSSRARTEVSSTPTVQVPSSPGDRVLAMLVVDDADIDAVDADELWSNTASNSLFRTSATMATKDGADEVSFQAQLTDVAEWAAVTVNVGAPAR